MIENHALVGRIVEAINEVEADYEAAVKVVRNLKERMNQLEQRISQEKNEHSLEDLDSLRAVTNDLHAFTDWQILKSKKVWDRYKELESNCTGPGSMPAQLGQLHIACKKTEQLAADLLCFSLGHLKQTSAVDK